MPVTQKARRAERRKVLERRLKEQCKNAAKVDRRIEKITREIAKLDSNELLERVVEEGRFENTSPVRNCAFYEWVIPYSLAKEIEEAVNKDRGEDEQS